MHSATVNIRCPDHGHEVLVLTVDDSTEVILDEHMLSENEEEEFEIVPHQKLVVMMLMQRRR